jgi:hypothetical protein
MAASERDSQWAEKQKGGRNALLFVSVRPAPGTLNRDRPETVNRRMGKTGVTKVGHGRKAEHHVTACVSKFL